MAKIKTTERTMPIADAVSYAYGELESLAEECREVVDNAEGGLANTQRIQTLDETASTLEGITEPDVEEEVGKLEIKFHEQQPASKSKGLSRNSRRDNAVAALDAAIQHLTDAEKHDDYQDLIDDLERIKDDAESVEFPGMYG
jgi:cytochrome P450